MFGRQRKCYCMNNNYQENSCELENEIIENSEASRKEAQESIKKQQELNKKLRDNQLVVQQEQSRVESKKTSRLGWLR